MCEYEPKSYPHNSNNLNPFDMAYLLEKGFILLTLNISILFTQGVQKQGKDLL